MARKTLDTALDALAAAALAGAIWYALREVMGLHDLIAAAAALAVFARIYTGLARLPRDIAPFRDFELAPLAFEADDALLLDRQVALSDGTVVRLFAPLPTPGELHQTIERHLDSTREPAVDPSAELAAALARLRSAVR